MAATTAIRMADLIERFKTRNATYAIATAAKKNETAAVRIPVAAGALPTGMSINKPIMCSLPGAFFAQGLFDLVDVFFRKLGRFRW